MRDVAVEGSFCLLVRIIRNKKGVSELRYINFRKSCGGFASQKHRLVSFFSFLLYKRLSSRVTSQISKFPSYFEINGKLE